MEVSKTDWDNEFKWDDKTNQMDRTRVLLDIIYIFIFYCYYYTESGQ